MFIFIIIFLFLNTSIFSAEKSDEQTPLETTLDRLNKEVMPFLQAEQEVINDERDFIHPNELLILTNVHDILYQSIKTLETMKKLRDARRFKDAAYAHFPSLTNPAETAASYISYLKEQNLKTTRSERARYQREGAPSPSSSRVTTPDFLKAASDEKTSALEDKAPSLESTATGYSSDDDPDFTAVSYDRKKAA